LIDKLLLTTFASVDIYWNPKKKSSQQHPFSNSLGCAFAFGSLINHSIFNGASFYSCFEVVLFLNIEFLKLF
jgi:hypothetical protein